MLKTDHKVVYHPKNRKKEKFIIKCHNHPAKKTDVNLIVLKWRIQMPRNMSFFLTTDQIRDKTKTVTRRLGWWFLKPGDILNACTKCQGLKKNQKIEKICRIRVLNTRAVPLSLMTFSDCLKEGFPNISPHTFRRMFTTIMKLDYYKDYIVNRIEFDYL